MFICKYLWKHYSWLWGSCASHKQELLLGCRILKSLEFLAGLWTNIFVLQVFRYSTTLEKHKLFISGLPFSCTKEELEEVCKAHGNVKDIRLVTNRAGKPKVGILNTLLVLRNPSKRNLSWSLETKKLGLLSCQCGFVLILLKELGFIQPSMPLCRKPKGIFPKYFLNCTRKMGDGGEVFTALSVE